jgi:hypothetical protein
MSILAFLVVPMLIGGERPEEYLPTLKLHRTLEFTECRLHTNPYASR